ncbi:unnamed protein product [Triticum turgidum subsp. durum]|uniref:Uncharacterized protein n=1 Tax=Triticum turgidum subsp. durum TaxID=4567 RepID=A0A9R1RNH2_TRITD|nr:unnamed protein product [Triticum turgidum subsp. durum]
MAGAQVVDSGEKRLNELGYADAVQDAGHLFLDDDALHGDHAAVRQQPPVRRAGQPRMGLGRRLLLHLVRRHRHGRDLLLLPHNWLSLFLGCSSRWPGLGSIGILVLRLAGGHRPHCRNWYTAYAGSQVLQSIILLCTGTNKGGGYLAPRWLFLVMYLGLTFIWAVFNTFALEVIAFLDVISMWWQVVGGTVIVIMLPLVAKTTQPASYVFTHFETTPEVTGISSGAYAVVLSLLVSQYSLYGYDAAAHLTEETKGADKNGPIAILSSIGIITVFGWVYILALTFSIQDFSYLYDPTNETAGTFVPAQILYDAFHGRYGSSTGAIVLLFIIWGSFFFGGLSITTSAARVVYALSRDRGVPFSSVWRKIHPTRKVPGNAVWLCAAVCALLGLPILWINVVFTAITSIATIGWVGGYAVPIFARMVMREEDFRPGPFYLRGASRPVCLVAFLWICYTCSVFLLPTVYPIKMDTFNYAPIALGVVLGLIMLWWVVDARKWFTGPVRNIDEQIDHNDGNGNVKV